MVKNSLGLIEVVGFVAAMEAADAAMKAANIELLGYELTKGGGLVLVKICGDVGAVTAGIAAGKAAASKVNKVLSTHVIPRPHEQLVRVLEPAVAILEPEKLATPILVVENQMIVEGEGTLPIGAEELSEIQMAEQESCAEQMTEVAVSEEQPNNAIGNDEIAKQQPVKEHAELCNLCNDPACHRKKGDPKITCIYYGKNTEK